MIHLKFKMIPFECSYEKVINDSIYLILSTLKLFSYKAAPIILMLLPITDT